MRFLVFMILPVMLFSENYTQIIALLEQSYPIQSAKQLELASEKHYLASQGKNLPSLDLIGSAIHFKDTPSVILYSQEIAMGTRQHLEGAIVLSYPLFSGFAISSMIDKAKFEEELTHLKALDLKRNLTIRATVLFSQIIAYEKVIIALHESQNAINDSYKKAKGFYNNGLLPISELYAIEAKIYDIESQLTQNQGQKQQLLNQLSALVNAPIVEIMPSLDVFSHVPSQEEVQTLALEQREDLKAVAKALQITDADIVLAKSKLYPTVGLVGAFKHQGDSLALTGDGYSNPDKSYIGVSFNWNIFNGNSDINTIDAARASKLSAFFTLENYKQSVATEIKNSFIQRETIKSALLSAQKEVSANVEYAKLVRGRFDNQLTSADELSRAIASLAIAKAKVATKESELFSQNALLWLQTSLSTFESKLKNEK